MTLPPYVHVDGLPANESLRHFVLKWAAYRVLTHELECPFALVEADAGAGASRRSRLPRHDALGLRFRAGRSRPPWEELPADRVRVEALDPSTGRWRDVAPAPKVFDDPTVRAFERLPDANEQPLRDVALARRAGFVRVRRSGGQRRELAQLCGADAKQSRADLQAWLREADRRLKGVALFVIVAPAGLARSEELPPKVGLAEVDLDRLLDADGSPAIRMARWPGVLRPGTPWAPERTAEFQRHAYYAMHGLVGRQLFWFLAQTAVDRRRAAEAGPPYRSVPSVGGEMPHRRRETSGGWTAGGHPAAGIAAPSIRNYQPADRVQVVSLCRETGIDRPWLDLGAELDRHPDPHLILVAEAPDGGVAGVVMGRWDGRRGWIHHLFVHAAHRRRGLGRTLLTAVETRLRELGAAKAQLMIRDDNEDVASFYHRCGYAREAVTMHSKSLR